MSKPSMRLKVSRKSQVGVLTFLQGGVLRRSSGRASHSERFVATRAVAGSGEHGIRGINVEGADAADVRAEANVRRGIGDMSVAERMRRRSQAREMLDVAELRSGGRGHSGRR